MELFIPYEYQPTTVLGNDKFLCVLRVVKEEGDLFPISQSIALENAQSDFQRRAGVASTHAASDTVCEKVNECKRKLAEYVALSTQKISKLRGDLETEMMHFENLNALRVKQKASIATHDVGLEELIKQQQIEDTSVDIVAQFRSSSRDSYDSCLKGLFLVPFNAAIDCNELQLVAKHIFVVLIHAMNHVCALGHSLTYEQVLLIYDVLHPGDPGDFSSNPNFCHFELFEKGTDYENFES